MSREMMPSMTRSVRARQAEGLPPELIRDFTVSLYRERKEVFSVPIRNNRERLRRLRLPQAVLADQVVVQVERTYGYPGARIFEIRIYV